jgi:single-stranded DNA-binding protein
MINKVTLGARIVSEIILGKTKNKEIPVANFRVVHNSRRLPNPLFIDVEVWGGEAERIYKIAARGDYVVLDGELRRDCWETRERVDNATGAIVEMGGQPRSKIKITASRVIISDQRKSASQANEAF